MNVSKAAARLVASAKPLKNGGFRVSARQMTALEKALAKETSDAIGPRLETRAGPVPEKPLINERFRP